MTIVRCPRCRDEVTLPDKASPRALVRCPLCLEEYLLAEVLADAPPTLIVIGGEVPGEILAPPGSGWGEPQASVEYRLADERAAQAPQSDGALAEPTGFASGSIAVGPGTGLRPAPRVLRPRRAEKSVVAEAVKVVAGGVIGLALGLLVLWWGLRRDPLELGPTFSAYVPWLVPRQFHGSGAIRRGGPPPANRPSATASTDTSTQQDSLQEKKGKRKAPSRKEPSGRDRPDELQTLPLLEEPAAKPAAAPELSLPLELPAQRPEPPKASTPSPPPPAADASRSPPRPPAPEPQDNLERAKPPPMPDLRDLLDLSFPVSEEEHPLAKLLLASSVADTVAAVASAEEALRAYEALPRDDASARQKAFAAWYAALGQVAQTLGPVLPDDEDPSARQASLHPLLDRLEDSPGKRSAAAHLTLQTWPQATHGQGLLVVGKVAQCFEQGPPYRLLLEVQVRDQALTLPLVLGTRPADFCQEHDELIVLGRVIERPHERLAGYADEHPKVLWVCLARRVPPAP
jgi:hypothetical protein